MAATHIPLTPDAPTRRGTSASTLLAAAIAGCAATTMSPPPVAPPSPVAAIETVVFLVGDGGNPDPAGEPVLQALRSAVVAAPGARVVVFLGDNVYPAGIPDSTAAGRAEAERRLRTQITAVQDVARVIFVPGNHDWSGNGRDGWAAVRRQQAIIAGYGAHAEQLPGGGCPGPAVVDVGRGLRLVAIDTHWWLRTAPKPLAGDGGCVPDTPGAIVDSLRGALGSAGPRHVAVLGHHPLATGGPHGGRFSWRDHIFPLTAGVPWLWIPLPILGSLYPLVRRAGWSDQDLSGARNGVMRDSLAAAFAAVRPLIYAAGHEHALQVIDGGAARHLVVSGAGRFGHTDYVTAIPGTRFAVSSGGFVRLDVLVDGRVRLGVITVDRAGGGTEAFAMWLDAGGPTDQAPAGASR